MGAPPTFQRAPRHYLPASHPDVEIPAPPRAPTPPQGFSLQSMLLPLGATALGMGVMYAASSTSGAMNPLFYAASIPMLLASGGASYWNTAAQGRAFRREVVARDETYRGRLATIRAELERRIAEERTWRDRKDPGPEECARRVRDLAATLWERSPGDPDFLDVRLGLGSQPSPFAIKVPHAPSADLDADPLLAAARELAATYADLLDAPVCLPLRAALVAGVRGPREEALNLARALAVQLATHHAPDEVKLAAIVPEDELAAWSWLRWLPHAWSEDRKLRYLAGTRSEANLVLGDLDEALKRRALNADRHAAAPLPIYVVFLADARLYDGEPILTRLLRLEPSLGACAVFVGDHLPNRCQAVVDCGQSPAVLVAQRPEQATRAFAPDPVPLDLAERFARTMAPIRLKQLTPTRSDIPERVPLLGLLGAARVEDVDLLDRWRQGDPVQSLAIPIGRQFGDAALLLDLHERRHGPHGLVAGQTRWGKTVFLRTFIALLAATYHPHEVAFVLIDYKGGDLFRDLDALPHVVGVIDNLQDSLARRALLALKGELRRRQELFKREGVGTIYDYQARLRRGAVAEPLPHLFLICDEFKELMLNQPDFAQQFISTACVGGSLGVHLILATQQPEGVVSDQIWANTRFRICFHFDQPDHSMAVLRRTDAATITVRGRGYLQIGDNEQFELFQSAYGDAPYAPAIADDADEIFWVTLAGKRIPLQPPSPRTAAPARLKETTELRAVVTRVSRVARANDIDPLPRFWQPPLPSEIALAQLRSRGPAEGWDGTTWQPGASWLAPVVGLLDDPSRQWQGPLRLDFVRDGNLGIYGEAQKGKTTFLQTLVVSLALAHAPTDVVFYVLDFGKRSLRPLAALPHVGGVIADDEPERLSWLLRYLAEELDRRKKEFARVGVSSLSAFRQVSREPMPAIFLILDDYARFGADVPDVEEQVARLAQEGPGLGLSVVVTAPTPWIRQKLRDGLPQVVTFHLAERRDYAEAVGRTEGLEPDALPGRGLLKASPPLEFQAALPVPGDEAARHVKLLELVRELDRAWDRPRPRVVPEVPVTVLLADLLRSMEAQPSAPDQPRWAVPLGWDLQTLTPLLVDLDDGPHFLIAGPQASGKTILLQSWLLALASRSSAEALHLYLVDFRQSSLRPLAGLPHAQSVRGYVASDAELADRLADLARELDIRGQALRDARTASHNGSAVDDQAFLGRFPRIVIAIDDFDAFDGGASFEAKQQLEALAAQGRDLGFHLIVAGSSTDLSDKLHEGLLRAVRRSTVGFVLGSSEYTDVQLLNLRMGTGGLLPAGQGFYAQRGRYRRVKVATPGEPIPTWVERLSAGMVEGVR